MKKIVLYLYLTLMISCVPESEHRRVENENEKLKTELEELKFGIPALLEDSKKLMEIGDYRTAKEKLEVLLEKHPFAPESSEAKNLLSKVEEEIFWEDIENSNNLELLENYSQKYPNGKYVNKIQEKKKDILRQMDLDAFEKAKNDNTILAYNNYLNEFPNGNFKIKAQEAVSILKEANQEQAYENAKKRNSSSTWERFLIDYPNHWDKANIKEKIISLKVDEILGDQQTGQLPSFSQTNYGNSTTSTVTIENDTGYELTVRYSGPSIKEIVIPKGSSKSTTLVSGSYKIAASAGGLNYAGREELSGNYSSSYYIRRSLY